MNRTDEKMERQINALLDGELNSADADQLKTAAADDRDLARAIVEAYQLQQAMDTIHVERAPASLRRRLRMIPRKHGPALWGKPLQPRWVMALAAVPVAIIAIGLMRPATPSVSEIAQARKDLAIAFAYLDKAGQFTGREIELTVGETMVEAVAGHMIRDIKLKQYNAKEKKA